MNKPKKYIKWGIYVVVIGILIYFLEIYGVIGILLFILSIALYRIYTMRESLKLTMRQIETMIWHKPLDKTSWDKGELKNTKVKVVWGDKKEHEYRWYQYSNVLFYPNLLILFLGVVFQKQFLIITALTLFGVELIGSLLKLRGDRIAQKNGLKQ